LEVVLHIFDAHVFGLKALLLVYVFHDVHFKPLAFLIFNRHTSIDIGWRFFLDLALSSLSARHRSTYSRRHPHPFFVLIVLVFNVIAEIIRWHAVNLFSRKLSLLLLPFAISLFLSSRNILRGHLLAIWVSLNIRTVIMRYLGTLWVYPVVILRGLNMRIAVLLVYPFLLLRLLLLHLLLLSRRRVVIEALLRELLLLLLLLLNSSILLILLLHLLLLLLRILQLRVLSLLLWCLGLLPWLELLLLGAHCSCGRFFELVLLLFTARLRI